jgi:RNA polymerase sigma-70 factor (ECF subfamily)
MQGIEQREQDLLDGLSADLAGTFERLMEFYQDRLYALALRLSGNAEDAEEIAQDAFVHAYRALCDYPPERIAVLSLRPWLYRIMLNIYRNKVRGKRVGIVSLEESSESDGPSGHGGPEPSGSNWGHPEEVAVQAELNDELAALLAGLPGRYRAAVVLRYVEGLSYAELAETLEQPIGTVKANVHRGVRQLRERMLAARERRGQVMNGGR